MPKVSKAKRGAGSARASKSATKPTETTVTAAPATRKSQRVLNKALRDTLSRPAPDATQAASTTPPQRLKRIKLKVGSDPGSDSSRQTTPTTPSTATASARSSKSTSSASSSSPRSSPTHETDNNQVPSYQSPTLIATSPTPRITLRLRRSIDPARSGSDSSVPSLVRRTSSSSSSSGGESDGLVTPENTLSSLPEIVSPNSLLSSSSSTVHWSGKGKGKHVGTYFPVVGKGKGKGKGAWFPNDCAFTESPEDASDDLDDATLGNRVSINSRPGTCEVDKEAACKENSSRATEGGAKRLCAMCKSWQEAVQMHGQTGAGWLAPADPEACETCRSGVGAGVCEAPVVTEVVEEDGEIRENLEVGEGEMEVEVEEGMVVDDDPKARADAAIESQSIDTGDLNMDVDFDVDPELDFIYPDWDPSTLLSGLQTQAEAEPVIEFLPPPASTMNCLSVI